VLLYVRGMWTVALETKVNWEKEPIEVPVLQHQPKRQCIYIEVA
jgi:hypothetical protein